jgi:hypothetical protein
VAPFKYQHRGMLAYVGEYMAVSDLPKHKARPPPSCMSVVAL